MKPKPTRYLVTWERNTFRNVSSVLSATFATKAWRRRHYRVKHAGKPGTFRFSVLDNGVVSNEYWRIVDVSDDLSWGEHMDSKPRLLILMHSRSCIGAEQEADVGQYHVGK